MDDAIEPRAIVTATDAPATDAASAAQQVALAEHIGGLSEAEKAELATLKAESVNERRAYKRNRKESAEYYLREGKRLKRIKAIVGHSWFMPWVEDNLKYSHETGRLYVWLHDAAEAGYVKFQSIWDLGLTKALAQADENEAAALRQRGEERESADERRLGSLRPSRQRYRTRHDPRDLTPAERATERATARQRETADALAYGEPDPHRAWPRPRQEGQILYIEWSMPDASKRRAYVWLADVARALADFEGAGPGPAALKYHAMLVKFGRDDLRQLARDHKAEAPARWEDVCFQLRSWSYGATQDNGGVILDRDPFALQIVHDLHDTIRAQPGVWLRADQALTHARQLDLPLLPLPSLYERLRYMRRKVTEVAARRPFIYKVRPKAAWEARANQPDE